MLNKRAPGWKGCSNDIIIFQCHSCCCGRCYDCCFYYNTAMDINNDKLASRGTSSCVHYYAVCYYYGHI